MINFFIEELNFRKEEILFLTEEEARNLEKLLN
jgi:hypothetical protein